ITTAFNKDDAQVCFFVPFPNWLRIYKFSKDDLRIHERALRMALINPELAPGFEAARTLCAYEWAMQHVCDTPHCEHSMDEQEGGGGGKTTADRKPLEDAVDRVLLSSR